MSALLLRTIRPFSPARAHPHTREGMPLTRYSRAPRALFVYLFAGVLLVLLYPSTALADRYDDDEDGYCDDPLGCQDGSLPGDCDDTNASVFPGAAEQESPTDCMKDEDEDGWGDDSDL